MRRQIGARGNSWRSVLFRGEAENGARRERAENGRERGQTISRVSTTWVYPPLVSNARRLAGRHNRVFSTPFRCSTAELARTTPLSSWGGGVCCIEGEGIGAMPHDERDVQYDVLGLIQGDTGFRRFAAMIQAPDDRLCRTVLMH